MPIYIKKTYIFKIALKFRMLIFNGLWSFENASGVRISTVRIVPTPLFKSELYLYSPLKKGADVYANQNGDRPPQSQQTNGWKNILLLQCSVHRVIITRSVTTSAVPPWIFHRYKYTLNVNWYFMDKLEQIITT